jgi:hypothetical protein
MTAHGKFMSETTEYLPSWHIVGHSIGIGAEAPLTARPSAILDGAHYGQAS